MDGLFYPLLLTVHILVGLSVIGLVLLQHGKGADMGAAFGSGASGSANFLSRTTAVLAAVYFLSSLGLTAMASARSKVSSSVVDAAKTAPAVPAPAPVPPPAEDSKTKDIPK